MYIPSGKDTLLTIKETLHQDFLAIGEDVDIQNCKINIKTLSQKAITNLNNKLSSLGIVG